jgi:hypothetical protein
VTRPATATVPDPADAEPLDPLALLERDDKWFLGGAPGLLYAPPTPVWDHATGFWDEAHFLHYLVQPVFTVTLIDEAGAAVALRAGTRTWRPHARVKRFEAPGLEVVETQTCGPEDVLSDVVTVRNLGDVPRRLRLVAWTAQSVPDGTLVDAGRHDGALVVTRVVGGLRGTRHPLALALDLEDARSWSLDLSEPCALQPHWFLAPSAETLGPEGLPNRASLTGVSLDGLVFAALERPIELEPGEAASVKVRAAVAPDAAEAVATLRALRGTDPLARSERAWRDHFAAVPAFRCADPTSRWPTTTAGTASASTPSPAASAATGTTPSRRGPATSGCRSPTAPSATCSRRAGSATPRSRAAASSPSPTTSAPTARCRTTSTST